MIKKSSELVGVLVISIKEGKEVGKVKEILIDPLKGKIIGMVLEGEKWYQEARVITSEAIRSLGEYAITIDSISSVSKVSSNPEIMNLLDKKIEEKTRKVITESGKLVGTVSEYFIDIQTQEIVAHELASDYIIPASAVLTVGEDVLVVSEDLEKKVITDISQLNKIETKKISKPKIEEFKKEIPPEKITSPQEEKKQEFSPEPQKIEKKESPPLNLNKIFEERQKAFMLGKRVKKRVEDSEGGIIAEAGEIVTEEIINKAKEKNKFVELFMNVGQEK
jgi:uncharacterized protein YrrD